AGEVVVERAGGYPRFRGDVLDPDLIPAPHRGQAHRGQTQRVPGRLLLALAQAGLVHTEHITEFCSYRQDFWCTQYLWMLGTTSPLAASPDPESRWFERSSSPLEVDPGLRISDPS